MKFTQRKILLAFGFTLLVTRPLQAQPLSDELNALDDFPAEDLSDLDGDSAAGNTPNTAKQPEESFDVPNDLGGAELDKEFAESPEAKPEKVVVAPKKKPTVAKPAAPGPAPFESQALTGIDTESSTTLTDLSFKQLNDRVRLIVKTDKPVDFGKELRGQRRQVIAELRNLTISNPLLKKALDTGEFAGPVAIVQAYESKAGPLPSVKILFQLREMVDPQITRVGNDLYIDFPIMNAGTSFKTADGKNAPKLPDTYLSLDGREEFTGTRISLRVKDAELTDVLNLISQSAGRNFVLGPGIAAKVTMNIKNEPWDKVLSLILLNNKLGYQKIGDTYRIVASSDLKSEITEATKTAAESTKLIPLQTRLIPVNYAKAAEVMANVNDLKSDRGKISVELRTNSLLLTDIPEVLDKIAAYVISVDKQTALVQIEARIVEASTNFTQQINLDWNLGPLKTTSGGGLSGSMVNVGRDIPVTPPRVGAEGGIHLKIGALGPISTIESILQVAETEERAKVIASPKVQVLNNREATLTDSQTFITGSVTTSTGAGASSTAPATDTAKLEITVKPQVTSDGYVLMSIVLMKEEPSASAPGTKKTRKAVTEMLVESGKTGVVGGVSISDSSRVVKGLPILRNIPIIGKLFEDQTNAIKNSKELLMFISPTIVNADKAFLSYEDHTIKGDTRTSISRSDKPSSSSAPLSQPAPKSGLGGGGDLNQNDDQSAPDPRLDELPEDVL